MAVRIKKNISEEEIYLLNLLLPYMNERGAFNIENHYLEFTNKAAGEHEVNKELIKYYNDNKSLLNNRFSNIKLFLIRNGFVEYIGEHQSWQQLSEKGVRLKSAGSLKKFYIREVVRENFSNTIAVIAIIISLASFCVSIKSCSNSELKPPTSKPQQSAIVKPIK